MLADVAWAFDFAGTNNTGGALPSRTLRAELIETAGASVAVHSKIGSNLSS